MDIKIAVAYHKECPVLKCKYLIPVHVGKTNSDIELNMVGDDEGDNISEKNPWYCELTALYWLWKNTEAEYKGLMHYRRAFVGRPKSFLFYRMFLAQKFYTRRLSSVFKPYTSLGVKKQYETSDINKFSQRVDKFTEKLPKLLKNGVNVIATHPDRLYISVRLAFCQHVGGRSIKLMDEIVKELYPDFYPHYMKGTKSIYLYYGNISIMDNATFEEYCDILFSVLKRHEEETIKRGFLMNIDKEQSYSRMSGYLGEMLTSAFIHYCKATKKVKTQPVGFLHC